MTAGCGQDTNIHSSSINHSLSMFRKNTLVLVRTAENSYKGRQSKLVARTAYGLNTTNKNNEIKSHEYDVKFTNKARPRCLPVESSIFKSNKQLVTPNFPKTYEGSETKVVEERTNFEKSDPELIQKTYDKVFKKVDLIHDRENLIKNRPRSVKDNH